MADIGVTVPSGASVESQQAVALSSSTLAIHYDGLYASGDTLSVPGSDCNGGGISFAGGDYWNDRISSTRHRMCTRVKHWLDANYQGASQLTDGPDSSIHNMNATLNNTVSSIRYYG